MAIANAATAPPTLKPILSAAPVDELVVALVVLCIEVVVVAAAVCSVLGMVMLPVGWMVLEFPDALVVRAEPEGMEDAVAFEGALDDEGDELLDELE